MFDFIRILSKIESGAQQASDELLKLVDDALVDDEWRELAAARLTNQLSDHALQAMAFVYVACVQLVDMENVQYWPLRGRFLVAAGDVMRTMLADITGKKQRPKHSDRQRIDSDASWRIPFSHRLPGLVRCSVSRAMVASWSRFPILPALGSIGRPARC